MNLDKVESINMDWREYNNHPMKFHAVMLWILKYF
jgi:hypothetical protein